MNEAEFQRIFKLPFDEAMSFFRDKLNIPTGAWNELDGAAHAKAFTSAGAYEADLLTDLRKMVDKAIAGDMDIRTFREQFRPLIERYGWRLQGGGPGWRADLIWRTNIQTAYQAGRWQQFQEGGIEFLMYVHKDGQMHPRPAHVALDGKIFPIDDPFWHYNYPPQGFGCKCRAVAARKSEYENAAPERKERPANYQTMADNGWGYNVGIASQLRHEDVLGRKIASLPADIASALLVQLNEKLGPVNDAGYAQWIDDLLANTTETGAIKTTGALRTVGFVEPEIAETLLDVSGIRLETSLITINDKQVVHTLHFQKGTRSDVRLLEVKNLKKLPSNLRSPQAVLYDKHEKGLVYVFAGNADDASGKWAVRVNLLEKKEQMVMNSVRTGAYVPTVQLKGSQYIVLKGEL